MSRLSRDRQRSLSSTAEAGIDRRTYERIGSKITIRPDGCWSYDGDEDLTEYHLVGTFGSRSDGVHRFVYEVLRGRLKSGYLVHHLCERPGCCNPDHLQAVTRSEHQLIHAALRRARDELP